MPLPVRREHLHKPYQALTMLPIIVRGGWRAGPVGAWPAATVPDYGDTASAPPVAPAPPAPTPPPTPAPAPGAAQLKSAVVTAIDKAYPPLAKVIGECPSSNPYSCEALYFDAKVAVNQAVDALVPVLLSSTIPVQCQELQGQLLGDLGNAGRWVNRPYAMGTYAGNIDAANNASNALMWLQRMQSRIVNTPGTCQ